MTNIDRYEANVRGHLSVFVISMLKVTCDILHAPALTKRRQHVMEVVLVNETVSVLVDHVEGLLEFSDLRLVEHGEDIGSSSLGALLVGATAAGGLAGRHLESGEKNDCYFLKILRA